MHLLVFLRLALRNVWRNPRRSLITLLAVSVGVWSSTSLSSLARGVSYGMAEDSINTLTGHIQIHDSKYLDDPVIEHSMPAIEIDKALELDSIGKWSARVRVPAVIVSERESLGVALMGIEPEKERGLSFIADAIEQGSYLDSLEDNGIVIGKRLADRLQTGLGKRVVIMSEDTRDQIAERGFRVKGIFSAKLEATELGFVFVSRTAAQKMLHLEGMISEISLRLPSRDHIPLAIPEIQKRFNNLQIDSWETLQPFVTAIIQVQSRFIGFWFFIVFVAVSFGLINTLLMSIFERTHELGLLQSLGVKPQGIMIQIVFESVFLLCIGAFLGNLMGLSTVWWLQDGIDISKFAAGAEHIGASRIIHPRLLLPDWIKVNWILFVMGIASSLYPAWRAARLAPQAALTRG